MLLIEGGENKGQLPRNFHPRKEWRISLQRRNRPAEKTLQILKVLSYKKKIGIDANLNTGASER